MELLIFALIVAVVVALAVTAWNYVPAPPPMKWIVPAVLIILGALVILARLAGYPLAT